VRSRLAMLARAVAAAHHEEPPASSA